MPKETISRSWETPFHVQVGWSAERDVQVGVVGTEGRSIVWLLYGSDERSLTKIGEWVRQNLADLPSDEQRGRELLNFLDTFGASAEGPGYSGIWSDLDRHGCNQLIQVVRRARDQAFGKDE